MGSQFSAGLRVSALLAVTGAVHPAAVVDVRDSVVTFFAHVARQCDVVGAHGVRQSNVTPQIVVSVSTKRRMAATASGWLSNTQ